MNIAVLIGNVASDPEPPHTPPSQPGSCCFRLAVSRPTDDTKADFFRIVTHGRQARMCRTYLSIGRRISVHGRLHGRLETSAGHEPPRGDVQVVAHHVGLLGARAHDNADMTAKPDPATDEHAEVAG